MSESQDRESIIRAVQREMDDMRQRIKRLERRIQEQELDHQEKILQLQHEFEHKNKGLLPAHIKQELESTITSLKTQVVAMQQRLAVVQEELEMRNRHITRYSPSRS